MQQRKNTAVAAVPDHLIEHRPEEMAAVFARVFQLATQITRGGPGDDFDLIGRKIIIDRMIERIDPTRGRVHGP